MRRTIAHTAPIAALALALTLLAACGGSSAATSSPYSATQLIQKASTNFAADSSLHFKLTAVGIAPGTYSVTSADGDVVRPDKLQVTSGTIEPSQGFLIGFAVVIIGSQQYIDLGDTGHFASTNVLPDLLIIFDPHQGIGAILNQFQGASTPAADNVSGVACWKITGTVDSTLLDPITGNTSTVSSPVQTTLWIGQSDSQIHQVKLVGIATSGDTSQTARTITLSQFNENVSIVAPSISGS